MLERLLLPSHVTDSLRFRFIETLPLKRFQVLTLLLLLLEWCCKIVVTESRRRRRYFVTASTTERQALTSNEDDRITSLKLKNQLKDKSQKKRKTRISSSSDINSNAFIYVVLKYSNSGILSRVVRWWVAHHRDEWFFSYEDDRHRQLNKSSEHEQHHL